MAAAQLQRQASCSSARYPITPASDILHELARHKNFDVRTFQAEDEIAAMTAAIGAAFGGAMAVTASSGPGIALKAEGIGLAVMTELPLLDHQRAARRALHRPADQDRAGRPAAGHVRPQRRVPDAGDRRLQPGRLLRRGAGSLADRRAVHDAGDAAHRRLHRQRLRAVADSRSSTSCRRSRSSIPARRRTATPFLPYTRDERLARPWAMPGTPGLMHRIGGLEKQDVTGNVNYDPDNHEHMVNTRARRWPASPTTFRCRRSTARRAATCWCSAGAAPTAPAPRPCTRCRRRARASPTATCATSTRCPTNLGDILKRYKKVLIPELNLGQLRMLIRAQYLVDAIGLNKVQGKPFSVGGDRAKRSKTCLK